VALVRLFRAPHVDARPAALRPDLARCVRRLDDLGIAHAGELSTPSDATRSFSAMTTPARQLWANCPRLAQDGEQRQQRGNTVSLMPAMLAAPQFWGIIDHVGQVPAVSPQICGDAFMPALAQVWAGGASPDLAPRSSMHSMIQIWIVIKLMPLPGARSCRPRCYVMPSAGR